MKMRARVLIADAKDYHPKSIVLLLWDCRKQRCSKSKEIPMNPFRKSVWQNRGTVSILATAIVLLVTASGLITASAAEKPNVLYILCDDLRPEAIGCLG